MRHLNQPMSACLAYHEEVEQRNKAFEAASPSTIPVDHDNFPITQDSGAIPDTGDVISELMTTAMDVDDAESTPSTSNSSSPFFEMYPGAAQTFGRGKTFMDMFNADSHAEKRSQYPYYPFASKAEWGLASFLLRSDLSMNSIDKFLKLELVSNPY